ncbi:MAG: ScyD/ScyE family protein [Chloroflexota bacterium]
MTRRIGFCVLITLLLFSVMSLVAAQDEPVASNLNNPRHIAFDTDGTLYIAEAGQGGDSAGKGPYGAVKYGETGQISALTTDGEQAVIIPNLISMDAAGEIEGVTSVLPTADSLWATLGMGLTEGLKAGQHVSAVVQYDKTSGDIKQVIDLGAFETQNNPDKGSELVSNPAALAFDKEGKLYIADASGNDILTWTEKDGLQVFAVWSAEQGTTQSVPTSLAISPDGDIYVGFLGGFPYDSNSARIEVLGADGKLKKTYSKLNFVTDILLATDGTLYAVQLSDAYGDLGFNPDAGSVVKVTDSGTEVVVDKLSSPYGIAQSKDGQLFVSTNALGATDTGSVIIVGGA